MTCIPVEAFMTDSPHSIGVDQPLRRAHEMMRKHRVRHLPVLVGGELRGILTERDLHLVESLPSVDPDSVTVEEAMTQEPYVVEPGVPLAEVAGTMAEKKYGCAVIMAAGKVKGIFTTVDACRALVAMIPESLTSA